MKCPLSQPRALVYCAPWPPRPGTPTRPRKRKVTKVGVYLEERCPISAPFCETLDFVTFERVRCEYAFTRGRERLAGPTRPVSGADGWSPIPPTDPHTAANRHLRCGHGVRGAIVYPLGQRR